MSTLCPLDTLQVPQTSFQMFTNAIWENIITRLYNVAQRNQCLFIHKHPICTACVQLGTLIVKSVLQFLSDALMLI